MAEGELRDMNPFIDSNSKDHCSQRTSLSLVGIHSKVQERKQTREGYFPQSPYTRTHLGAVCEKPRVCMFLLALSSSLILPCKVQGVLEEERPQGMANEASRAK